MEVGVRDLRNRTGQVIDAVKAGADEAAEELAARSLTRTGAVFVGSRGSIFDTNSPSVRPTRA